MNSLSINAIHSLINRLNDDDFKQPGFLLLFSLGLIISQDYLLDEKLKPFEKHSIFYETYKDIPLEKSISLSNEITLPIEENMMVYSHETIKIIQGAFRKYRMRKLFRKALRRLKYRKNIFRELIETEKNYVENLGLIITNVIWPIKNKKIELKSNERDDFLSVFSNIECIKTLHQKFHQRLSTTMCSYSHFSLFGHIFLEFFPFFKLYFIYCEEFENNMKLLERMKVQNSHIRAFLEEKERSIILKEQDLTSLMIMPVQRLCRYVLFLKDLLKYSDNWHQDFPFLEKSLSKVLDINQENNEKMDTRIKNLKLLDLQRLFGSEDFIILDSKRDFICEEPMEVLLNSHSIPAIVYFLTDLVLVTEHNSFLGSTKLLISIYLDENSSVRNMQNTKYFSHLFSVHGNNTGATFMAGSEENKEKYAKTFQKLINNLKVAAESKILAFKKNSRIFNLNRLSGQEFSIEVSVIGTEERFCEGFFVHTVYIIEIRSATQSQRIYLNYSEIYDLYKRTKREFPNIKLPVMERLSIFYKKTKTIESRKILIENFLQTLLRNEKIRSEGSNIIQFLNVSEEIMSPSNQNLPLSPIKNTENFPDTPEKKGKKFRKEVVLTSMSKILIESSEKRKNNRFSSLKNEAHSREISVKLMDNSFVKINIQPSTTASEACLMLSREVKLSFYDDFRLFLVDSENNYKVLEDDEVLFRFLFRKEFNDLRDTNLSFFKRIGKKIKNSIDLKELLKGKMTLVFKKYIFLERDLETRDWTEDMVRTRLIAYQLFNDVALAKFALSFNDYSLITSFYGFDLFGPFSENLNLSNALPKTKMIIPSEVYSSKPHEFWNTAIIKKWQKLSEKINEKMQSKKDGSQKSVLLMSFIKLMQKNEFFGTTFFNGEVYKNLDFKNPNVCLGVRYDGILIVSVNKRERLLFEEYRQIKDLIVHPKAIIFEFQTKSLRLNTCKSFEISQLIKIYQKILAFQEGLE